MGNWLTAGQGKRLLQESAPRDLCGKRNHAMLALLIGGELRRGELLSLTVESIQLREEHWVIANLSGKAGHIRTVPIPCWVKAAIKADMKAMAQGKETQNGRILNEDVGRHEYENLEEPRENASLGRSLILKFTRSFDF